jgi:DNA-binding CsgD family transcriptional regulator
MLVSSDIAARTNQLIGSCKLDSLSIFLSARSNRLAGLTYLFHHGVSEAAQYAYKQGRVFEDDPFPRAIEGSDRSGQLISWNDRRISGAASSAREYRQFINCHSVDVVGAWVQQVMPQFFLVIGAHCRPGGHRKSEVSLKLLANEAAGISQMIVSQLLEEALGGTGRRDMLKAVLDDAGEGGAGSGGAGSVLSSRELQIAELVGTGNQNKQVAFIAGISEFTVENHLRRIYRKLGVHNRAGMAAKLFGGQTRQ